MDEAQRIKRVKVLTTKDLEIETPGTRAMMEVLLEVCDENLEVWISEVELRTLVDIHTLLYRAAPFQGVHELIGDDSGVDLFFADLRELVQIEDQQSRASAWVEIFKDFGRYCREAIVSSSAWTQALLRYSQDFILFHHQCELALVKKPSHFKN